MQCDGNEEMASYTPDNAPLFILNQVMNGEPTHCEKCDGWLVLTDPRAPYAPPVRPPTVVLKVRPPSNPSTHPQGMKWWPDGEPYGPQILMD